MKQIFRNCIVLFFFCISFISLAQTDFKSLEEMKKKANTYFEKEDYVSAKPLYSQLVSVYSNDPIYNYRFGVCLLTTDRRDVEKSIKYLEFAAKNNDIDVTVFYYLGIAYHRCYRFSEAIKQFNKYKEKAGLGKESSEIVDRQIEICKNARELLAHFSDLYILEKTEVALKDFFRSYDAERFGGKILIKPDIFKTPLDKKRDELSLVFFSRENKDAYFSSYGKDGKNGKDIYRSTKLSGDKWSKPVNLGPVINTSYDDDFPFILPDGVTMYFSSKGRNTIGGYDIFTSTMAENGTWSTPENLNYPINTPYDDIMFVPDSSQETAYFSSVRTSAEDMITVYKVRIDKRLQVEKMLTLDNQNVTSETDSAYNQTLQYLKHTANLEVNATESMFADNSKNNNTTNTPVNTDNLAENNNNTQNDNVAEDDKIPDNITNEDIVKLADKQYKDELQELNEMKTQRDAAKIITQNKKQQADANNKEAEKIINNVENITDESAKQSEITKANQISSEAEQLTKEALIAGNIADQLDEKINIKQKETDEALTYANDIKKAVQSNSTDSSIAMLNRMTEKLEESNVETDFIANYDPNKEFVEYTEEESKKLSDQAIQMQEDVNSLKQEAENNRKDASATKKKNLKEQLLSKAIELDNQAEIKQKEADQILQKSEALQSEADSAKAQSAIYAGVIGDIKNNNIYSISTNTNFNKTENSAVTNNTTALNTNTAYNNNSAVNYNTSVEPVNTGITVSNMSSAANAEIIANSIDNTVTIINNKIAVLQNNLNKDLTPQQKDKTNKEIAALQKEEVSLKQTADSAHKEAVKLGGAAGIGTLVLDENSLAQNLENEADSYMNQADEIRSEANSTTDAEQKEKLLAQANTFVNNANAKQIEALETYSIANTNKYYKSSLQISQIKIEDDKNNQLAVAALLENEAAYYFEKARALKTSVKKNMNYNQKKSILTEANTNEKFALEKQSKAIDIFTQESLAYTENAYNNTTTVSGENVTTENNNTTVNTETNNNTEISNQNDIVASDINNKQNADYSTKPENARILSESDNHIASINNEIENLKKQTDNTYAIAYDKNNKSLSIQKEVENLMAEANTTTNAQEKEQLLNQANELRDEANIMAQHSVVAFNVAKTIEVLYKEKQQKVNFLSSDIKNAASSDDIEQSNEDLSELKSLSSTKIDVASINNQYQSGLSNMLDSKEYELLQQTENVAYLQSKTDSLLNRAKYLKQQTKYKGTPEENAAIENEISSLSEKVTTLQQQFDDAKNVSDKLRIEIGELKIKVNYTTNLLSEVSTYTPPPGGNVNVDKNELEKQIAQYEGSDNSNILAENIQYENPNYNETKSNYITESNTANTNTPENNNKITNTEYTNNTNNITNNTETNTSSETLAGNTEMKANMLDNTVTIINSKISVLQDNLFNETNPELKAKINDEIADLQQQATTLKKQADDTRSESTNNTGSNVTGTISLNEVTLAQNLENEADSYLNQADEKRSMANQVDDVVQKEKLIEEANENEENARSLQVEAHDIYSIANTNLYYTNSVKIDKIRVSDNNDNQLATAKILENEAELLFNKARMLRDDIKNELDFNKKMAALDEAKNNEQSAIEKQNKAIEIYTKASLASNENLSTDNNNKTVNSVDNTATNTTTENTYQPTENPIQNNVENQSQNINSDKITELPEGNITETEFKGVYLNDYKTLPVYMDIAGLVPLDPKLPSGIVFKVQIAAVRNHVSPLLFKGITPLTCESTPVGLIRYMAGLFAKFEDADNAKNNIRTMGYNDAFVVAYHNNKRITVDEAIAMLKNDNSLITNYSDLNNTKFISTTVSNNVILKNAGLSNPVANIKGLFYTVQIGVYVRPVTSAQLFNISPIYDEIMTNGYYRYFSGIFSSFNDAVPAKNTIVKKGITDAFIVAYYNGRKISITDARNLQPETTATNKNTNINSTTNETTNDNITNNENYNTNEITKTSETNNAVDNSGLVYKVQLGAFEDEVPLDVVNLYIDLVGNNFEHNKYEDGLTTYTTGNYTDYVSANTYKDTLVSRGLTDVFVVAFLNNKKIQVNKAREMENK